jgi:MFS superfamily sulfate permease-like transporter
MSKKTKLFANLNSDFAAGLVVFLVALPLCLGIALASGAPLFSGIIAGVIGGIVVGFLSKSHLSVSGPAAGLTAIVLTAITTLGNFQLFLLAVFIAGIFQLILGFIKAGSISSYFPNNVIEGMLAGIGVIIFTKQIPHAVGYDKDYEGDMTFIQNDGQNTFSELFELINNVQPGAIIITIVSLLIIIIWNKIPALKNLKLIPAALVAVIVGVIINQIFENTGSNLAIRKEHLVSLPIPKSINEFKAIFIFPDFSGIMNKQVWIVAATIAVVASIETLLCIEASDKMDKNKRITDTNVELKAQGIGNMISALLGGLPMTSVVVRTTANANAGAESKISSIIHGVLLMVSALTIPFILNKIPLATLAAILLLIGYKLANPKILKHFWDKDKIYQFIPFLATLLGVVFIDLLKGVALGLVISIIFVLKGNMQRAYQFRKETLLDGDIIHIDLAQEVSFLNKSAIKTTLASIPENSKVIINASETIYIAHDVLDLINDFKNTTSVEDNINVDLVGFKLKYGLENTGEENKHVFVEKQYIE